MQNQEQYELFVAVVCAASGMSVDEAKAQLTRCGVEEPESVKPPAPTPALK